MRDQILIVLLGNSNSWASDTDSDWLCLWLALYISDWLCKSVCLSLTWLIENGNVNCWRTQRIETASSSIVYFFTVLLLCDVNVHLRGTLDCTVPDRLRLIKKWEDYIHSSSDPPVRMPWWVPGKNLRWHFTNKQIDKQKQTQRKYYFLGQRSMCRCVCMFVCM